MKPIAIAVLLAGALALGAAACGGGSRSSSNSLTKQEYASELNRICAGYNAAVKKIGRPSSIAGLASKGRALLSGFDRTIAQAEQLKPPKELQATADKFVAEAKELRKAVARLIDAVTKRDAVAATQAAARAEALAKDGEALGRKLGAPACAQT